MHVQVFVWVCFNFSWVFLGVELLDHRITVLYNLLNDQTVSQSTILHSHQSIQGFNFSTSSPSFVIVCLFDPSGCEVVSHILGLYFLDGWWCWASFCVNSLGLEHFHHPSKILLWGTLNAYYWVREAKLWRLYDSNSVTFWKRQNCGDDKKISGCQELGGQRAE